MSSWVRRIPGASLAVLAVIAGAAMLVITGSASRALAVPMIARPDSAGAPRPAFGIAPGLGLGSGLARAPGRSRFGWPLAGHPRVVGAFDPPAQPWLPGHRGVDLATTLHQHVFAAGAGTVAFAGRVAGVGVVSIVHAGGLRTTYEPVAAAVHAGDAVATGSPIGVVSLRLPHCATGVPACLHWGLIRAGEYLDPLTLLGLGEVRLYPSAPIAHRMAARIRGSPAASRSYSSAWL